MAAPAIGARVVVPLGPRVVTGIVVEASSESCESSVVLKPIRQVLDAGSFVPPDVVALARWTAEYYAAGVGDTIPALLPPMARGGRADAHKTTRVAAITGAGVAALAAAQSLPHRQREALEILATSPTGIGTPDLAARGIAAAAISRLAKHGYISLRHDRVERDPWSGVGPGSDRGQTGVRPGSDWGQTGVRLGSDRGQTGVRPGSDWGQTPLRPQCIAMTRAYWRSSSISPHCRSGTTTTAIGVRAATATSAPVS